MMYIDDDVMEGNLHSESDTLDFSQKIVTRIRACAKFPIQNPQPTCAHARIPVAIFGQPTGNRFFFAF